LNDVEASFVAGFRHDQSGANVVFLGQSAQRDRSTITPYVCGLPLERATSFIKTGAAPIWSRRPARTPARPANQRAPRCAWAPARRGPSSTVQQST